MYNCVHCPDMNRSGMYTKVIKMYGRRYYKRSYAGRTRRYGYRRYGRRRW